MSVRRFPAAISVPGVPLCVPVLLLSLLSFGIMAGCKSAAPPASDAMLTSSLNRQLSQDGAIAGQPVTGSVQAGVATLSGNVANDAQRIIAARDAAGIAGVTSVNNQLAVIAQASLSTTTTSAPPAPMPVAPPTPAAPTLRLAPVKPTPIKSASMPQLPRTPAPVERVPPQAYLPPPQPQPLPMPRTPPLAPSFHEATLAAGTTLSVRITQTLDSATTQPGDSFSGVVASDVLVDGLVAIPAGASVFGHVDAVQEAAHFKGNSLLTISLASVRVRGASLPVSSDPYSVQGKGRGKNTAIKAGGGAAVGAILGGIFGGGKGAAIGAAAGGGVGAGANAVTRGEQVQIASESIVRFQTASPVTLRVRSDAAGRASDNSTLQPRP